MKKVFLIFILKAFLLSSGLNMDNLFVVTDRLSNNFSDRSYSYQLFSESEFTKNKEYEIKPIGRLITVKIINSPNDKKYETLKKAFTKYYSKNPYFSRCYQNDGGSLTLDFRNPK